MLKPAAGFLNIPLLWLKQLTVRFSSISLVVLLDSA